MFGYAVAVEHEVLINTARWLADGTEALWKLNEC